MLACTPSYLVAVRRKVVSHCFSVVSFTNRKCVSTGSERDRKIMNIQFQNIIFRKIVCSSLMLCQNLFGRNCGILDISKNYSVENRLITSVQQYIKVPVYPYSTSVQEHLSLSNVKVNEYISHLKDTYQSALEHRDNDNIQLVRNLKPLMELVYKMESLKSEIEELHELAKDSSGGEEMQQLANSELQEANTRLQVLEEDVLHALVPTEPFDDTDITIEVSAGVGGQEAMLFCQEIFDMYQAYANYMGWESEITDCERTDIGGLRHGVVVISGEGVYRLLKYEGGIHRVQRIPKTEKAGRIHTSTVSVAVMPQPSEIDIQIAAKDLKIETKRASGAGGQHVNTTDSAVRILHIPSGIAVESQKERSQHRNREECMRKLRAQLYQQQLDESINQYSSSRKLQVGTKARSEKIRTYNYPQDRVTDHRIGVSLHNLPSLLEGMDALHSLIYQVIKEAEKEHLLEIINNIPVNA